MIYALVFMFCQLPFAEFHQYKDAIEQLDDDKFTIREEATRTLYEAKERAIPVIFQMKEEYKDKLEVRMRLEYILERHIKNIRPTDSVKFPWIDCLPYDVPDRDNLLLKFCPELDDDEWRFSPEFQPYREGTEKMIRHLFIEKRMSENDIVKILDRMVKNEDFWGYRIYKNPPDFPY